MPRITMNRGFIAHWRRMPHSIARLSASASSHHGLSSAAFITNIAESDFRHAPGGDRQLLNRLEAWRAAPLDFGFVDRQLEFRPAPEQGLQCAGSLYARELMAKAEMNPGAEGNMAVRLSLEIELLWICVRLWIQVRGCQHRHDLLTLP